MKKTGSLVLILIILMFPLIAVIQGLKNQYEYSVSMEQEEMENRIRWELKQLSADVHPSSILEDIISSFFTHIRARRPEHEQINKIILKNYFKSLKVILPAKHQFLLIHAPMNKPRMLINEGIEMGLTEIAPELGLLVLDNCSDENEDYLITKVRNYFNQKLHFPIHTEMIDDRSGDMIIHREADKITGLIFIHNNDYDLVIALMTDLTDCFDSLAFPYHVANWPHKDFGPAFLSRDIEQSVFGMYFDAHADIKKELEKSNYLLNTDAEQIEYKGYQIYLRARKPLQNHRIVIVHKTRDLSFSRWSKFPIVLAIASLYVILALNICIGRMIFQRGQHFSLRTTTMLSFLISSLFWSSTYGISVGFQQEEFRERKYAQQTALRKDLEEVDRGARRYLIEFVHRIKSFSTISAIAGYTGLDPQNTDINYFFKIFLEKFNKDPKYTDIVSDLIISGEKDFQSLLYYDQGRAEIINSTEGHFKFLAARAQKLINEHNSAVATGRNIVQEETSESAGRINFSGDDLLEEIILDNMGMIFGGSTFLYVMLFPERLFEIVFKRNGSFFLRQLVKDGFKAKYALSWFWRSIKIDPTYLMWIYNTDKTLEKSTRFLIKSGSQTRPEVFPSRAREIAYPRLAQTFAAAQRSDSTVIRQEHTASGQIILTAFPGKYIRSVISGQRDTFEIIEKQAKKRRDFIITLLGALLTTVLLGWLCGNSLLEPLKDIMHAIAAINREQFETRLNLERSDEYGSLAAAFNMLAQALQEGRILQKFISRSVRDSVQSGAITDLPQRANTCNVTILFSGYLDFKTYRTGHSPTEILQLLQRHLSYANDAVKLYGGEIDKMIGDKIMIVFRHDEFSSASEAVEASLKTAALMHSRASDNVGSPSLAIGINTGSVLSGVVGAASVRLDYTVIGDSVNLASRLADLAQITEGTRTVISGTTRSIQTGQRKMEKLPFKSVKGKTREIEAWLICAFD